MKINYSGLFGIFAVAAMIVGCYLKDFNLGALWLYVVIATALYVAILITIFTEKSLRKYKTEKFRITVGIHLSYLFLTYGIYIESDLGFFGYIAYFIVAAALGFAIPLMLFKSEKDETED